MERMCLSTLVLLVGQRERHPILKTSMSKPLGMEVTLSGLGYSLKYRVYTKNFSLSCEDAQDKDVSNPM